MRILISNDDGIEAPGIALAAEAASLLTDDVWVVAPDGKRTAAGPSLTVARPLTMRRLGERRFSCSGTPADCIVTSMGWLFNDGRKPDLVVGGVNDGRNVGEDLAYSGTLGIAREATFWGIPAIGFSRVKEANVREGDAAWLARFIERLWQTRNEWSLEGHWLSVNLPADLPASVSQPSIGRDKIARKVEVLREDGDEIELVVPRGREHASRKGDENSLIAEGFATVNRLNWFGETQLAGAFMEGLRSATK
ncbi:5'(3')-nucleotidase/polyphosphatase [Nitratireductor aquibiodomus RA22]|uniref:5'-nucleotidase n=2 Tax=Nitratireductor aquibiodomus TaxID=204799 RepID=A0A1H4Q036_9HYPH|nr:5'/3'-nucleotidase SurE [Nitratireductor aquibiodomus]EIM71785.1 5'(3')-nucleotidase/polyphosphatase [Nitratireductor aquibiodomus RA22]SEC13025.1 5'-nucleotidase [Nitratireductor aquibiodomus]